MNELDKEHLRILLNKISVIRSSITEITEINSNLLSKISYILKSIDVQFDQISFNTIYQNNVDHQIEILNSYEQSLTKQLDAYISILRKKSINGTWNNDWIKIPKTNEFILDSILNKIRNLCNFNISSLYIGYEPDIFIDAIKSSEPIYTFFEPTDESKITSFLEKYNILFQNKIRTYDKIIDLPKNAMGLIILWNYVHLRDTNQFKEWISPNLYGILKPGGVLIINYPDLYNSENYDYISNSIFGAYDSLYMESQLYNIGFEIIEHDKINQIIIVKKPGFLTTGKSSPTISTIVNIDSIFTIK